MFKDDINEPCSFILTVEECSRNVLMSHVVSFELINCNIVQIIKPTLHSLMRG